MFVIGRPHYLIKQKNNNKQESNTYAKLQFDFRSSRSSDLFCLSFLLKIIKIIND